MTIMSEGPMERQEGTDVTLSGGIKALHDDLITNETEENVPKQEEQEKDTVSREGAAPFESTQMDGLPIGLSSPEAAPSVTIDRKNDLLLQARADRMAWIQTVPLPYSKKSTRSTEDKVDPWNEDDRLTLLRNSNAVQSLPCIPQVLSSLYGMEQGTSEDIVVNRIQSLLEPLGLHKEECELATTVCAQDSLATELSSTTDTQQQALLEAFHEFVTKLKTPECASLVSGMKRFLRNLPETQDEMASALRSYLSSTFESLKSNVAWKNRAVDDSVKHALESFMYGHCRAKIETVLKDAVQEDEKFLERLDSLQFITSTHLEIECLDDECNIDEILQESGDALLSLDAFHSPFEKLQRALKVYRCINTALSTALSKKNSSKRMPSADDVLPTLILTILRSKPPRLVSSLRMIEVFSSPEYLRGEAGYAYTNLYGAFRFLQDLNMDNPESLSIKPDDFRRELQQCRTAAKARLEQATVSVETNEAKKEDAVLFPINIPVREVRAARLRGESVDINWAKKWQTEHEVESTVETLSTGIDQPEGGDSLPDLLPGFSRSYSYMVTRPEDIRVTDLPQLLSEYRMLVHSTEQLLGERSTRQATERKQRFAATQSALLARAAEVDLSTRKKKGTA